jgi:hypothetical protein
LVFVVAVVPDEFAVCDVCAKVTVGKDVHNSITTGERV